MNYAKSLPFDVNNNPLQEYPAPVQVQANYNSANAVASSVININPNTTSYEIGAFGGQGIVIRWIPLTETASVAPYGSVIASGLGANFTHYVPPSTYRRFVVPKETQGQTAGGQIGSVQGLYQRLAWINAGIVASSVLSSEF